ncbi:MAG: hypothetical protein J0L60_04920 [Ignavibacteria bacterium]|nr:hypothetical protein [Ignavibacteria bacterium]
MIPRYLAIILFLVTMPSFGQYLSYGEMTKLLDFKSDTSLIKSEMAGKGFYLNTDDSDSNGFRLVFESPLESDDYFVGVFQDLKNDMYTVIEYTKNHIRWEAYITASKENGYIFSGMKNPAEGTTYFTYMKDEMLMGLLVRRDSEGTKYQFSFTR